MLNVSQKESYAHSSSHKQQQKLDFQQTGDSSCSSLTEWKQKDLTQK